jgi:glucose-1-phosphate cytidylyltransferase
MKVVILAGGLGTRISEESIVKPKPMIEIGEKPILWHIMKTYSFYGFNDFIICLGYKGYQIKEYFANYFLHESDVTFDFSSGSERIIHNNSAEPWRVTLVNTGNDVATGGRVRRIKPYIGNETFMLTYGDGVADVDVKALVDCHRAHGKIATVTAARPIGRFGALNMGKEGLVKKFQEKAEGDNSWINAGYFVMEPTIFDYLKNDQDALEKDPLVNLTKAGQLAAYKHAGFWYPMDTVREKQYLESLWLSGQAPWKVWK